VRFLADESCDFAVVTALRGAGRHGGGRDERECGRRGRARVARADARVLLTEDKDFGRAVVDFVTTRGDRIPGAFIVREPGRARISRP
jgi:predicted nuclease of predicted toxin-antitoxin system